MPKKIEFTLSETELSTIEQVIRSSQDAYMVKRSTALRMLHLGQSPATVAEILTGAQATPYKWFHRFREEFLRWYLSLRVSQ